MNNNSRIDYEEFMLSHTLLQKNARVEQVTEDFKRMQVDGCQDVTWPTFFKEYSRLLDAIPQPIEEKLTLIRDRTKELAEAICRKNTHANRGCCMITSPEEFLDLLRDRFQGSLVDAFFA